MTGETMSLRVQLPEGSASNSLSEMVFGTAVMELEVESLSGAAHSERRAERINPKRASIGQRRRPTWRQS